MKARTDAFVFQNTYESDRRDERASVIRVDCRGRDVYGILHALLRGERQSALGALDIHPRDGQERL